MVTKRHLCLLVSLIGILVLMFQPVLPAGDELSLQNIGSIVLASAPILLLAVIAMSRFDGLSRDLLFMLVFMSVNMICFCLTIETSPPQGLSLIGPGIAYTFLGGMCYGFLGKRARPETKAP